MVSPRALSPATFMMTPRARRGAVAARTLGAVSICRVREYDPTNGLIAGANLIRVGVTREASQAIPISGGFLGDATDPIGMHVDVSVSAVPIR
jgi:hypothetical protein